VPRKDLWQLAEAAGHPDPDRLQGFLAKAACDAGVLRDRIRAVVERLAPVVAPQQHLVLQALHGGRERTSHGSPGTTKNDRRI
jgi:hypothetical protein